LIAGVNWLKFLLHGLPYIPWGPIIDGIVWRHYKTREFISIILLQLETKVSWFLASSSIWGRGSRRIFWIPGLLFFKTEGKKD
jgi:hypothetical protein